MKEVGLCTKFHFLCTVDGQHCPTMHYEREIKELIKEPIKTRKWASSGRCKNQKWITQCSYEEKLNLYIIFKLEQWLPNWGTQSVPDIGVHKK